MFRQKNILLRIMQALVSQSLYGKLIESTKPHIATTWLANKTHMNDHARSCFYIIWSCEKSHFVAIIKRAVLVCKDYSVDSMISSGVSFSFSNFELAYLVRQTMMNTTEPRAEDEGDAQPHIRDGSILPRFFAANTGTRNRYDSRLHAPDPRAQSIQPAAETTAAVTPRSTTADVQIVSPYINGNDEICIPEVYCKKRGAWGYVWVGVMYQY